MVKITYWINPIKLIVSTAYHMQHMGWINAWNKRPFKEIDRSNLPAGRAIICFVKLRVQSMVHTVWALLFRWSWIYMYIGRSKLRSFIFSVASFTDKFSLKNRKTSPYENFELKWHVHEILNHLVLDSLLCLPFVFI